jgi:hypothetical protein
MKKLIYNIVLFVLSVSTLAQPVRLDLSESQTFLTVNNAVTGEHIAKIKAYPEAAYLGDAVSFSLLTNSDNIYAVNDTGMISISNDASLDVGVDSIEVRLTKGTITDDIWVYIQVADSANCIFVDPSGDNGSGTKSSPVNVFPTASAGDTILLKRGTTLSISSNIVINDADSVTVSTYGTGMKAKVRQTSTDATIFRVQGATQDWTIRDLDIAGTTYIVNETTLSTANNAIYSNSTDPGGKALHCDLSYAGGGVGQNNGRMTDISWNKIFHITNDGILSLDSGGDSFVTITGNYIYAINESDVYYGNESGANGDCIHSLMPCLISWNYCKRITTDFKFAIIVTTDSCDVLYNYVDMGETHNRPGIYVFGGVNDVIGNFVKGTADGLIWTQAESAVSNNIMVGANGYGLRPGATPSTDVFNNIFYECTTAIPSDRTVNCVNNILYDVTNLGQTSGWTYTLSESSPIPSGTGNIEGTVAFTDAENEDFRLLSTSDAIDAGTDVGLTVDFAGTSITGTPDIGAYEYTNTYRPSPHMIGGKAQRIGNRTIIFKP